MAWGTATARGAWEGRCFLISQKNRDCFQFIKKNKNYQINSGHFLNALAILFPMVMEVRKRMREMNRMREWTFWCNQDYLWCLDCKFEYEDEGARKVIVKTVVHGAKGYDKRMNERYILDVMEKRYFWHMRRVPRWNKLNSEKVSHIFALRENMNIWVDPTVFKWNEHVEHLCEPCLTRRVYKS